MELLYSEQSSISYEQAQDLISKLWQYPNSKFEKELTKANTYDDLSELKKKLFPVNEKRLEKIRQRIGFEQNKLLEVEKKIDKIMIQQAKKETGINCLIDSYNQLNKHRHKKSKDFILGKIISISNTIKMCEELIDHTEKDTKNRELLIKKIIVIGNIKINKSQKT